MIRYGVGPLWAAAIAALLFCSPAQHERPIILSKPSFTTAAEALVPDAPHTIYFAIGAPCGAEDKCIAEHDIVR